MHNIKPNHLWKLTPRKQFNRIIQDRLTAHDPPHELRPRKDLFKMMAVFSASVVGTAYSFGMFSGTSRKINRNCNYPASCNPFKPKPCPKKPKKRSCD